MKYKFQIPIGDWSGDGHNNVEWFICSSNKPVEEVREAYFRAKEELPSELCPENFVNEYEESTLSKELFDQILERFPALRENKDFEHWDNPDDPDGRVRVFTEFMAAYVVEFLKAGDDDLRVSLVPGDEIPMLPFYGYDEKRRHIGFIGYGITTPY